MREKLIRETARRTGYSEEVCARILTAAEEALREGISDKVRDASESLRNNAIEAIDLLRGAFSKKS